MDLQGIIEEDYFIEDPITNSPNLSDILVPPYFLTQNNFSFQVIHQASNPSQEPIHQQLLLAIHNPRNTHKKPIYEMYTRLKDHQTRQNVLNKEDPYIRMTVIKNINGFNLNQPNEYYINEFGLIGSMKNTDQEDIIIGRQEKIENQNGQIIFPNDIILREQDRYISRIHCKISCKNFFSKSVIIKPLYKTALQHIGLPQYICLKIQKFLEEPKECVVQDIGSVFGTHIRVGRSETQKIYKDQQYSVGTDTTFQVIECHVMQRNQKPIDEQFDKIIEQLKNVQLKCLIHGLDSKNISQNSLTEKPTQFFERLCQELKQYNMPFLLLKFAGSGIQGNHQNLFFAASQNLVFSIGRGSDNNMRINSNTISRKQTRFLYVQKKNQWIIADGCQDKESANGTWLQLSTVSEKEQRQGSQMFQMKHLSEIKISDYILKIELFKSKKQQKVDKQMIKSLL